MSSPAPGFPRLPRIAGQTTLEHTRTVAELCSLAVALNQSGFAFGLVDTQPHLSDVAPPEHPCAGRAATVTLLPMDSAGDMSLRLIAFRLRQTVRTDDPRRRPVDAATSSASFKTMMTTISEQLPIGALSRHHGGAVHLDYTLAVDALGAVPSDTVVDVVHLLDELFTSALRSLQALVAVDAAATAAATSRTAASATELS